MSDTVSDTDLHTFIDGELTLEGMAAVEAVLAHDPLLAARVHDFRADKLALIAAYGPLADTSVSIVLLTAARTEYSRPARQALHPAIVGAAAAALAASLLLTLTPRASRDPVIEQALVARENTRAPSRDLNHDLASIVRADQAMSALVGNPIHVPDLGRAGFKLVSAEIYGRTQADSIQLRYGDDAQRLFTVFLRPPAGADAFEVTERGAVRICVWRNADITVVMIGEMRSGRQPMLGTTGASTSRPVSTTRMVLRCSI